MRLVDCQKDKNKMFRNLIKNLFRKFGIEIMRYKAHIKEVDLIALKQKKMPQGNVLLSYVIEPFLSKDDEPLLTTHTHFVESYQIAKTFLDLGYSVDVIDYNNGIFVPKKDYAFFVSARTNLQRIAQFLNSNCVKIAHLDMSHWIFNNHAAYTRCLSLQQRKGVSLRSYKMQEINNAIEYADYAVVLGNSFTVSTYSYAQKPIFPLCIPAVTVYPWQEDKDYDSVRNNYLWLGSSGLVHKGLDLTLDAFARIPNHHLYICGPIQQEKQFENAYYSELYKTPNIHTIGWVDVTSSEFIEIANKCIGLIYPSCAEGQSGAVVTCLQAGLIPIASYESGVDVNDFGVMLKNCSIDEIVNSIKEVSRLPIEELKQMSQKAWRYARTNHTLEKYAVEYRKIIEKIQNDHL